MIDLPTSHDTGDHHLADTLPDTAVPSGSVPPSGPDTVQDHPRYRFGAVLGRGSSAQVLEACDLVFDRMVAVKVLADPGGGAVARFIREAHITALLDHPNVVTVHDLDFDDRGHSFMVMKRVLGISLGEALRSTGQGGQVDAIASVNAVLGIILKVCDALSRAHARGICHRDVKPDNILLGSDGEVMLVDWGEASVSGEDSGTRRGTPVGTPLYMSPEQARGERSGPAGDIYGLGATLFHTLIGRPPQRPDQPEAFLRRRATGAIDAPDRTERARVPAPLLAIVLKALAADGEGRYASIAALRDDLLHFQAGLAVSAFRDSVLARWRRWMHRHRGAIAAWGAVLTVTVIAAWFMIGERLKERAVWGRADMVVDFTQDGWRETWKESLPGAFTVEEGWLVSKAPEDGFLTCQDVLTPPLAVEYDARILTGSLPCDMSLVWTTVRPHAGTAPEEDPGISIKFGAFSNTCLAICRLPDEVRLVQQARSLEVGRTYHMRVEFEDDRITAFLDGRQVMSHREMLPLAAGRISLLSWYPGKAFANVRIYRKEVPEKTSILAVGDSYLRDGDCERAEQKYAQVLVSRVSPSVIEEARYRRGLAWWSMGRHEQADADWSLMGDARLRDLTACLKLGWQADQGRAEDFERDFRVLWPRVREFHQELMQHWQRACRRAICVRDGEARALIPRLMALHEDLFPGDPNTSFPDATLRVRWGPTPELLASRLQDRRSRGLAMIALGRIQELAKDGAENWEGMLCLWHQCRLDAIVAGRDRWKPFIEQIRIKQDRLEGLQGGKHSSFGLLAVGRAEEVLRSAPQGSLERMAALILLGRLQEAADEPVSNREQCTWSRSIAQILLRREDDAAGFCGANLQVRDQALWMRAREAGEPVRADDAHRLEQGVVFTYVPVTYVISDQGWFIPWFAAPFLASLGGDQAAFDAAMERVERDHANHFASRPLHLARLLRGRIDREAFLLQPVRSEAEAWLHVGLGMRAERAGDLATARLEYRAFTRLPPHRRLLIGLLPDALVERFVAWRLTVLEDQS